MKNLYTFILLLTGYLLSAQNPIPNPSFENWASGKPVGWSGSHISIDSPGHTGSYAVKGNNHGYLVSPGTANNPGFGISQCYCGLTFYYKLTTASSDYFSVDVTIYDSTAGHGLWDGYASITNNTTTFQQYTMPIQCGPGTPTAFYVDFGIANNSSSGLTDPSSFFLIDDVALVPCASTGIRQDGQDALQFSIFPDPAHDHISIMADPAIHDAQIEVYNTLGEKVSSRIWRGDAIQIDISMLPAGLYLFTLRQDGTTAVRKVQKD